MQVELVAIEMKKSKAGDPAIQLVLKSENGDWIREYIGLEKAPDFVWERWANAFGIVEENVNEVKLAMGQVFRYALVQSEDGWKTECGKAFDILGKHCEVECETEEYQGKKYLKVKDAKPIGVAAPTITQTEPEPVEPDVKAEVPSGEIPF
jgi:hypothetical protein